MDVLIAFALAATIAVPGRSAATPSIAARGSLVVVAFGATDAAGATDIYAAVSRDGAHTFGSPVRVNDVPGDARVGGEQPPRVEIDGDTIVVVWTSKGPRGTRLMQARSDGGRSFAHATVVSGSDAAGNRGWESIAGPFVLWLDHRELAAGDAVAAAQHMHAGRESMTEKSKLYFGSLDGTRAPRAIAAGVCYCCKTSLTESTGGTIYAVWRHVFAGSVRDIAFTMSRDGGRTFAAPVRVSDDRWQLQGCPENGPALAVSSASPAIHVVWPTLVKPAGSAEEGGLALFYARSAGGRTFTPRQRVPTDGTPRHPQVAAMPDGSLAIVWDEGDGGRRRAVLARTTFDASGRPTFARTVLGDGVYPAVALAADAIVIAWTSSATPTAIVIDRR